LPARSRQAGGFSDELEPYVDLAETDAFNRMGELLRQQRPAPRPGLLGRVAAGPQAEAPSNLGVQVLLALVAGFVLLGLALLGASGSGPLGG
jgi:hypothetical protein